MVQPEPVDAQPVARMRAVKAVIPAAGLATRFLPATKAVPKELLPVVDTPVLQYIVEEAAAAGIGDVLLVTGRGKTSMVDHFDRKPDLERRLTEKGDMDKLAAITRPCELAEIYACRQGEPLGLGHAVSYAELHVGAEPFAVLLGDEFMDDSAPLLPAIVFDAIRRIEPGSGGEIQLTDAMALMLAEGTPVHGIVYRGVRYDTGLPLGYLQAVVQIACQRRDLGPAFSQWLVDF